MTVENDRIFRPRKFYRNTLIVCLIFFLVIMFFSVGVGCSARPDRKWIAVCFFGGFWGFWIVLSAFYLLAYYRESLLVQEKRIVQKGLFRTRSLDLAELTDAHWREYPQGGSIVLR